MISQVKTISRVFRNKAVIKLARQLARQHPAAEIFLVGGYVRDLLLARPVKDIDLVVRGVPIPHLVRFLKRHGTVNLVGKNFGVFKFVSKGSTGPAIDVALPRREYAFGTGGYRDVRVQSNWRLPIVEDLSRRDFTMNALAWNILTHELADPFGGAGDVRKKIIRAVGVPATRFREDYSRMLRALRFACQLNFTISPDTWHAMTKNIHHLNDTQKKERIVPQEVIGKEVLKAFMGHPTLAFDLFDRSGATRALLPELLRMKKCPQPKQYHREGDVWTHTQLALEELMSKKFVREYGALPNAEIIMATLFHDIGKPHTITMPKKRGERIRFDGHDVKGAELTKTIAERLRLSSYKDENIDVDAERLAWLVRHHLLLISGPIATLRATTIERYYLRDERLGKELLALQFADGSATRDPNNRPSISAYRAMQRRISTLLGKKSRTLPPPILNGNEIMNTLRIKPGPAIGRVINELREAQLRGLVATKAAARTFIKKLAL